MNISSITPFHQPPTFSPMDTLSSNESAENVGSVLQPVEEVSEAADTLTVAEHAFAHSRQSEPFGDNSKEKLEAQHELGRHESQQEQIEQQQIRELSARDREVRNHEQAHAAVGGQYAGAPRYQYQRGPDGINYAVSGEVSISTGAVSGDPQQTIEKAQIIRRAALAPADPSQQDRRVAADASQMEAQARVELAELQQQEQLEQTRAKDQSMEARDSISDKQNTDKASSELSEEQNTFQRLSSQLEQRIVGRDIEPQVSNLGQLASRYT